MVRFKRYIHNGSGTVFSAEPQAMLEFSLRNRKQLGGGAMTQNIPIYVVLFDGNSNLCWYIDFKKENFEFFLFIFLERRRKKKKENFEFFLFSFLET